MMWQVGMATRAGEIERLSDAVAELLGARVSVLDERGTPMATSEIGTLDLLDCPRAASLTEALHVPMRIGPQTVDVVIQPVTGERISPRLAQTLVEWTFAQNSAVARLASQHELKDKFINDLLLGTTRDEDEILREAQILGMDLTRPRAVILVGAADYILEADGRGGQLASETRVRRRARSVIDGV